MQNSKGNKGVRFGEESFAILLIKQSGQEGFSEKLRSAHRALGGEEVMCVGKCKVAEPGVRPIVLRDPQRSP